MAARRKAPEIALEWKDLTIQLRYCAGPDEEEQEFAEVFPRVSDRLVSAACVQDLCQRKRKMPEVAERPGSRAGNTLAQLLSQNCDVNSRGREGSVATTTDTPSEVSSTPSEEREGAQESSTDLPETHNDIKMSKLIELSSGSKGCHICGKVFGDSTRIKRHLLSHSKEKPFKCHLCGWGFHQKCNMERHLASHTAEGEGHACPRCNSWFTTKSVLSLHLKDAHNEKYIGKKDLAAAAAVAPKREFKEVKLEEVETVTYEEPKIAKFDHSIFGSCEEPELVKYEPVNVLFPALPGIRKGTFGPNPNSMSSAEALSDELTCHLCAKTFVKKTNLKHHLMLHRGEKPWKCHICCYRFVQKCNLKKHIETHATGSYKCPQCPILFASKGAVAGHMSIVHLGTELEDSNSTETLQLAEVEMEEEEAEIAPPQEKVVMEPKKPSSPAMLWWKQIPDAAPADSDSAQDQKLPPATVPVTPKTLLNIPKVIPKATPSPPKLEAKTLPCSKCNKMFNSKLELDKHTLIHNATTKPYACPVCGWRFHLIHNMKRHLTTHEESGDIEVGTADELLAEVEASATRPPPLTSPRSTSSASGSAASAALPTSVDGMVSPNSMASSEDSNGHFKCNICNKWFTEAVGLSRHMEVHSADRPFACPICGWRFKQVQNMKRHMLTHSGAKPYSCDFCDKSYSDNYSLKQHVAKIHPGVASSIPNMLTNPNRARKSGPNAREVTLNYKDKDNLLPISGVRGGFQEHGE